jgi:tRNA modification GTPase
LAVNNLYSRDTEPIVALCTPMGPGALALVRLCGAGIVELVDRMTVLSSGKRLTEVTSHTIHYGNIVKEHEEIVLDHVLFLVMHGPRTFTGQDTIEISCHNNPFIIQDIIQLSVQCGARLAMPGEFSKRAVLEGKIDLIQAEAIADVIHANTQQALKKSLSQIEGSFSHWILQIEQELLRALSLCQASFEFIEEENLEFGESICAILCDVQHKIAQLEKSFDMQLQLRQGIRIALIGSVNAGKSSLFNALIHQNRAIVSSIPGTTRDVIESGLYKNGNYWTVIDTAGLRLTSDSIEQEGISRSFVEAQKADVVLLIFDGSQPQSDQLVEIYSQLQEKYAHKIIAVATKSDAAGFVAVSGALVCSALMGAGLEELESEVQKKIETLFATEDSPFLLNTRQQIIVQALDKKIKNSLNFFSMGRVPYELLAYHLEDALAAMADLTGKSISEAAMDKIFRDFCVGK